MCYNKAFCDAWWDTERLQYTALRLWVTSDNHKRPHARTQTHTRKCRRRHRRRRRHAHAHTHTHTHTHTIIKNVSWAAYYYDFWRSRDTEDCSNDAENTEINDSLIDIHIENSYLKLYKYFKIVLYFWSNKCSLGENLLLTLGFYVSGYS